MQKKTANEIMARAAASEIILELGIRSPEGIDIEGIAASRGALVLDGPLDSADAWILRDGSRARITVSTTRNLGVSRRRFAIAHELGHWELHPDLTQYDAYTEADSTFHTRQPEEQEANIFAAELLMPTIVIRPMIEELTRHARPRFDAVRKVAERFATSPSATAIRFVELSMRPCALIASENGWVIWTKRTERFPFFIGTEFQIHEKSSVWETMKQNPTDFIDVPSEAWCKKPNSHYDISEHSFRASSALVLTFLHVD